MRRGLAELRQHRATIREGHRAAHKALEDIDAFYDQPGGVYPRRRFEIEVDRDKCIGCGLCVSLAPNLMGLDAAGKAYTRTRTADWSPADGDFVQYCPTSAIVARKIERIVPLKAGERGRCVGGGQWLSSRAERGIWPLRDRNCLARGGCPAQ